MSKIPNTESNSPHIPIDRHVLDVVVAYQEHVLPMIPSAMTVKDNIKA